MPDHALPDLTLSLAYRLRQGNDFISYKNTAICKGIRTLKETKGWLVYPLSASGNAVSTLISKLSMENFIDSKSTTTSPNSTTSVSGDAFVVSGNESINVSRSSTDNEHYYSGEATLTRMIETANRKRFKVLIGVDDISKTREMIHLLSIIGSMILEGLQVYLIVTGLSENIEDFSSVKNLTFFKRADSREMKSLNKFDIVFMYEKLLNIDSVEAMNMQKLCMGYAYAYQVLGSLYFSKKDTDTLDDLIPKYERILFRDSYDLIWQSLSKGEKEVVRCIFRTSDGSAAEIKALMKNPSTYPVYRSRLTNKHLVEGDTRGYLKIRLPRFDRFIELWGED